MQFGRKSEKLSPDQLGLALGDIEQAIAKRYNLTFPWPKAVKLADEKCCHAELNQNIRNGTDATGLHDVEVYDRGVETPPILNLQYWKPELAEKMSYYSRTGRL